VPCRAGITGAATIAFAREETILDLVPKHHLEAFYHSVVLPAKHQLDEEYMASATFTSDLKLIIDSVLRRWDAAVIERLLKTWAYEQGDRRMLSNIAESEDTFAHPSLVPHMDRPAPSEEMRAY
jgi:hypothetical protein